MAESNPPLDQPPPDYSTPPQNMNSRWDGLKSDSDDRRQPRYQQQGGTPYDVKSRWDNRSDNVGNKWNSNERMKETRTIQKLEELDQPPPNYSTPPPKMNSRWDGLKSDRDDRRQPRYQQQGGTPYDVKSRLDNRSDNVRNKWYSNEPLKENRTIQKLEEFDQPPSNYSTPPPKKNSRWDGLKSDRDDRRPPRYQQQGGTAYDVKSRLDNRFDNVGNKWNSNEPMKGTRTIQKLEDCDDQDIQYPSIVEGVKENPIAGKLTDLQNTGKQIAQFDEIDRNTARLNHPNTLKKCFRHKEDSERFSIVFLRQLEKKEPSRIVMTLANRVTQFKQCLLESATNSDLFKYVLNVLAKAFSCNSLSSMIIQLFSTTKETRFFDTVALYLVDLQIVAPKDETENVTHQLKAILKIVRELTTKNPSSVDIFSRIHITLGRLIESSAYAVDEDVIRDFKEYSEHKERISTGQRMKPTKKLTSEDKELPPEDFRNINVFPQKDDLLTDLDPFLRKNKEEGGYIDLNHYMDVQFRLLREDFIGPLRSGVTEYIQARQEGQLNPKVQDVRVYNNVWVNSPIYDKSGVSFKLQFDLPRHLAEINWKSSKRLLYGSLICISPDNFNTIYFASVVDRIMDGIKNGTLDLVVHFEHDRHTAKTLLGRSYTMVETTAYFESYRHVLTAMQKVRPGDLPFENYIVQCETNIKAPSYLKIDDNYDLRPLVDAQSILQSNKRHMHIVTGHAEEKFSAESEVAKNVKILDLNDWPSAELLHLDESQFKAIQKAITKEFAIIQGPPGTGKTYIGLKIVKALLHNKQIWSTHPHTGEINKRPILVVCYTNHALDQFLEGIVGFFKGDVVRVGGQSKSDILRDYNLKCLKQSFIGSRNTSKEVHQGRLQAQTEYDGTFEKMNTLLNKIRTCCTDILHERILESYMEKNKYFSLTLSKRTLNQSQRNDTTFSWIVKWIGIESLAIKKEHEAVGFQRSRKSQITKTPDEELIEVHDEVGFIESERRLDENDIPDMEHTQKTNHNDFDIECVAFHVISIGKKPKDMNDEKWEIQKQKRDNLKRMIAKNISSTDVMSEEEANKVNDIWALRPWDKWRLYRLWLKRLVDDIKRDIGICEEQLETSAVRLREINLQVDKEILNEATVIGMTTTGAARYQSVLQEIGPRIIIVEEAAEVLEGHIITTLSEGCEHLILIGDHKQLKPNPTLYRLAVKYHLNLSLFERMINNGVDYNCLQLQHRMRPEIAELVHDIYEDLQNHDDVKKYEDVRGMSSNIFLINHKYYETELWESRSHSNSYEAEFAVALCRYLLLQDYAPGQITILTTYSGQMFCLQRLMPRTEFDGVKITVVDNYQGEENDIIILSLVRSNKFGNIGFLKTENRICVALSRAKIGCYILGNFNLLTAKSDLWKSIISNMELKNQISDCLYLNCQNHPNDDAIEIRNGLDFRKAPEGGCSKMCDVRLSCGHVCAMFCHVKDKTHSIYRCRKACTKILCKRDHICPKECFEICGKCVVPIMTKISICGHMEPVPCHFLDKDLIGYTCQAVCQSVLSCGHDCTNVCGDPHTTRCTVLVEKTWACEHTSLVPCYKFDRALCPNPCSDVLKCDHICSGTCGECFNGRLHKQCRMNCKRILICGHECTGKCNNCPPCNQHCGNRCKHSKCVLYCGEPCKPCMEPCAWRCRHYACSKRCSEPCDRPRCNRPCMELLNCEFKHPCIGLCGEPCPPYCRICDKDIVTTIIFGKEDRKNAKFVLLEDCGHIVEATALHKYMTMTSEDKHTGTCMLIKLKGCPICTTPIRKNHRYGTYINSIIQDIEKVKITILGGTKQIEECNKRVKLMEQRRRQIKTFWCLGYPDNNIRTHSYDIYESRLISERKLIAIQNQNSFENEVKKLSAGLVPFHRSFEVSENEDCVKDFLKDFLRWVTQSREHLTDQEICDFQREIVRYKLYLKLKHMELCIGKTGKGNEAVEEVRKIKKDLTAFERFTEERENEVRTVLRALLELTKIDGLGINEEERAMIVKTMNLSKGHWFKCPNNHVYAIGECGGATQEGNCPECKAKIGGKHHRLADDNDLAKEMDGASYAAYSEEANNMGNFQLDDLL